jgi:hypothetical protein
VSFSEGVATIETWKLTMPLLDLMVGTVLHVLEAVFLSLGSEDGSNINFLCNVHCPSKYWVGFLMKGSGYLCSYPCHILI